MNQPTTTLARIKAARPCRASWGRFVKSVGGIKTYGADTPIILRQIVETCGLDDALWCLRTMPEHNRRWRLLVVRYARRVQHHITDPRSRGALDVAERYARGMATEQELAAAAIAALAAARDAAITPKWSAAWAAAHATGGPIAWSTESPTGWPPTETASCAAHAAAGIMEDPIQRAWQTQELLRICEEDFNAPPPPPRP